MLPPACTTVQHPARRRSNLLRPQTYQDPTLSAGGSAPQGRRFARPVRESLQRAVEQLKPLLALEPSQRKRLRSRRDSLSPMTETACRNPGLRPVLPSQTAPELDLLRMPGKPSGRALGKVP